MTLFSRRPETKRILARACFLAGVATLLATSRERSWSAEELHDESVESSGLGDDKRIVVSIDLSGPLALDVYDVRVKLGLRADRQVPEVFATWLDDEGHPYSDPTPGVDDEPKAHGFFRFEDGLVLDSSLARRPECMEGADCKLVFEALVSSSQEVPYALECLAQVQLFGHQTRRPAGEIEVSLEVLDSP